MNRRNFVAGVAAFSLLGLGIKPEIKTVEYKLFGNGECTLIAENLDQAEKWYMKECGRSSRRRLV